jgi:uncharacterized protein YxeA
VSTKKKVIIFALVLLVILGVAGACVATASEPAQSPGIEIDVDHKKKSKDKKSKPSSSSRK